MFDKLSNNFEKIVQNLRGKAIISESDLESTLREIRIALLEADVALVVVKNFIEGIKSNLIGQKITKTIKPDQMIIKLVYDELLKILGSDNISININNKGISKILFCGLQGSGKTTSVAKLANFLKKDSKKKILMSSLDIYRPAALEQLRVLGEQINIEVFTHDKNLKIKEIMDETLQYASKNLFDIILFDTAGRQVIDEKMMQELKVISNYLTPDETILVADSLTGQDAANIAKNFNDSISITSNILTRIDGDSRGGAALSIKSITGAPIKFLGTGEKIDQLEKFYPDRIANRILGKGDIVSLVEKASENFDKQDMEKLSIKMSKGRFDLQDYSSKLKQMNKLGGISGIMSMLPGVSNAQKQLAEKNISTNLIKQQVAIISSMTNKEKKDPEIIKASRKIRISKGSGTKVQDVNKLLKQFLHSKKMMKKMKSMSSGNMPNNLLSKIKGNLPPNFNN